MTVIMVVHQNIVIAWHHMQRVLCTLSRCNRIKCLALAQVDLQIVQKLLVCRENASTWNAHMQLYSEDCRGGHICTNIHDCSGSRSVALLPGFTKTSTLTESNTQGSLKASAPTVASCTFGAKFRHRRHWDVVHAVVLALCADVSPP